MSLSLPCINCPYFKTEKEIKRKGRGTISSLPLNDFLVVRTIYLHMCDADLLLRSPGLLCINSSNFKT
jgi:hypothetical protein